jgi:hypothetical protein
MRIFKEVTQRNLEFIVNHGDGRIRQDTYDAYEALIGNDAAKVILVSIESERGRMLAMSASILEGKKSMHNITLTHTDYRRKGLGSLTLAMRLSILTGYSFETIVASDNVASNRLVSRVGLRQTGSKELTRKKGEETYEALVYNKCDCIKCEV